MENQRRFSCPIYLQSVMLPMILVLMIMSHFGCIQGKMNALESLKINCRINFKILKKKCICKDPLKMHQLS